MLLKHHKAIAVLLTVAGLTACSTPRVSQEIEMPARNTGMIDSKKLAVFNINGDQGGRFTSRVESYLANVSVRGRPYFEVLERQMLDKIIAEQKMVSSSGLFDEKDAVKLGDLAGADTLIMGHVHIPGVAVRKYHKTERVCRVRDDAGKCSYWGDLHIPCEESTANIDFTLKAVGAQKGSILFSQMYSGKASRNVCSNDSGHAGISNEDLENHAMNQVLQNMRRDVAPYTVVVTIKFMEKDDVMSKASAQKVEAALEFVEQKRVDRACEIFREALAADTRSPALSYNLGVCAEIGADFEKAERLYNQADRNTSRPVELISHALSRVKLAQANKVAVEKQMH